MSNIFEDAGWVGTIILIIVGCFAIYYVVLPLGLVIMAAGAGYGGVISLKNYYTSFSENVKLEKPKK